MKMIRLGAFETNSSSAHSLVLNTNCKDSKVKRELRKYPTLNLWLGSYGWEYAMYSGTTSKLEYIITSLLYIGALSRLTQLFERIIELGVEEIIVDGISSKDFESVSDFVCNLYENLEASVDHQSSDLLEDLSKEELLQLACSDLSYIQTSNDNGGYSEDFPKYVIDAIKKEIGESKWQEWKEKCKEYSWYDCEKDTDIVECNMGTEQLLFKGKIED